MDSSHLGPGPGYPDLSPGEGAAYLLIQGLSRSRPLGLGTGVVGVTGVGVRGLQYIEAVGVRA